MRTKHPQRRGDLCDVSSTIRGIILMLYLSLRPPGFVTGPSQQITPVAPSSKAERVPGPQFSHARPFWSTPAHRLRNSMNTHATRGWPGAATGLSTPSRWPDSEGASSVKISIDHASSNHNVAAHTTTYRRALCWRIRRTGTLGIRNQRIILNSVMPITLELWQKNGCR